MRIRNQSAHSDMQCYYKTHNVTADTPSISQAVLKGDPSGLPFAVQDDLHVPHSPQILLLHAHG